jgi:hypothetical protein
MRGDCYYIVETKTRCLHCGERILVIAFLLPEGHAEAEPMEGDPDEFESKEEYQAWLNGPDSWDWRDCGWPAMLFDIQYLSPSVVQQLREHTGADGFRKAKPAYSGKHTWQNHCPLCKKKQGDDVLHDSSGSVFAPPTNSDRRDCEVTRFDEPFEADAAYHSGWYGFEF